MKKPIALLLFISAFAFSQMACANSYIADNHNPTNYADRAEADLGDTETGRDAISTGTDLSDRDIEAQEDTEELNYEGGQLETSEDDEIEVYQ